MNIDDHRPRVAAERRERMRQRLMATALRLVARKGPTAMSIDDVISAAEVSRGTFYKYFPAPDVLVRELAVEIANELIRMAEPVVLNYKDPAARVACGIRLVSRLSISHPIVAGFLVRLGWPDVRGPDVLLDFVRRDLNAGLRQGCFKKMPIALALNIVAGSVLGAANCMLDPDCEADFAEQTAAAALRALGVDAKAAERIARQPLEPAEIRPDSLLAETLEPAAGRGALRVAEPARASAARRSLVDRQAERVRK